MAQWTALPALWKHAHPQSQPQQHALSVLRLPGLLLDQDRDCDAQIADPASQVGVCNLSAPNQSQRRVEHEAPPGYRCASKDSMVLIWVLPVPLLPSAMTFSRRSMYCCTASVKHGAMMISMPSPGLSKLTRPTWEAKRRTNTPARSYGPDVALSAKPPSSERRIARPTR